MMLQKKTKKNIIQIGQNFHLYKISIDGDSGSAKTNKLFNLISQQPDIDKIY